MPSPIPTRPAAKAPQPPRRFPDIEEEYVGADEEHDEPLDDVREVARQLRLDDSARVEPVGSPEEKPAEEQRAQQGAQGGIAPEESHGDAEEAHLAERDVECAELVVRGAAEHVDPAGETRKGPGDRHRADQVLPHVDAAVRGGVGIETHRLDLVTERRPVEERPEDDEGGERDEDADVDALKPLRTPEIG